MLVGLPLWQPQEESASIGEHACTIGPEVKVGRGGYRTVFHARCLGRQVHCIDATAPDVGADLAQARWHMARPVVQQHQRRHLRLMAAPLCAG